MIKLSTAYSRKQPIPNMEFSSHSYHTSLEVELPTGITGEKLKEKVHECFCLVRTTVEAELSGNTRSNRVASSSVQRQLPGAERTSHNENVKPSQKQLNYLVYLAKNSDMPTDQLLSRYNASVFADLNKSQASELIEELNRQRHQTA